MTTTQFKLLLTKGTLNDPTRPFSINLNGNLISDIAIRLTNFSISHLQQATSITLSKLPESGQNSFTISVENKEGLPKRVDKDIVNGYFVYTFLQNQPTVVGSINYEPALDMQGNPIGLTVEDYVTEILIEPGEVFVKIENSDYQVLQNNASTSRISTFHRVSDRKDTTINPLNILNILAGTADLADIQESNYSNTGWINSRYEGSSTNSQNYGGVDPVLTVKEFEGSFFPFSVADDKIQTQDPAERTYETLLHTGTKNLPTFESSSAGFSPTGNVGMYDTVFTVQSPDPKLKLNVGDILVTGLYSSEEFIKIQKILNIGNNSTYTVEVMRAWSISRAYGFYTSATILKKVIPVNIYRTEENKPIPISESKIRLRDTGDILYLDKFGTVLNKVEPQIP